MCGCERVGKWTWSYESEGCQIRCLDVVDKRGKGYLCVCVNSFVSYLCVTTLPVNTTPQIHQTSNISFWRGLSFRRFLLYSIWLCMAGHTTTSPGSRVIWHYFQFSCNSLSYRCSGNTSQLKKQPMWHWKVGYVQNFSSLISGSWLNAVSKVRLLGNGWEFNCPWWNSVPQACCRWHPPSLRPTPTEYICFIYWLIDSFIFGKLGNSHLAPYC